VFDLSTINKRASPPDPESEDLAVASWSPIVARDTRPIGFRLELRHARMPLADGLDAVLSDFVAEGTTSFPHGLVVLAPIDTACDESLVHWSAPRNVLLEVDSAQLDDQETVKRLCEVQRRGVRLALRVPSNTTVARERLPLFQYVLAGQRPIVGETAWLATLKKTRAEAEAAFKLGANAVVGWPLRDLDASVKTGLQPTQQAALELIRLVQADADLPDLERGFKREPVLAYLLLTLANSPAFIRSTPVASLSQAIALLGYQRLVKWLVLLLVIAAKDTRRLPQIYTAVARGFCMENLAAAAGADASVRDSCFVVGAFSLLDAITGQPLWQLLSELRLPEAVGTALQGGSGPFAPYLKLACALEVGDAATIAQLAAPLSLPPFAVRSAILRALAATDALQSIV
jgi:EAL and modified HD-GYP domain-containing signal transduction protein